ncbi:hypothetical protein Lesp02_35590 [Lentzea sp. NBRC 105346]|nr:hypothetical protein Lesp02_35590 [Lentzea sp. NBRC 105346]
MVHIVLRPAERGRCVEIAREIGAAPNHVHFACPIMIGTSRPVIGKRLPSPEGTVSGVVGVLDTPPSAEHGALVEGVLRHHAPGVTVRHADVLTPDGFGDDLSLARGLREMVADVVLVASGTYTFDDRCPPVLARAFPALSVVAAAGNGGSSRPWWPAADSAVTGVGALDARFSGTGPWVDVWEAGVDVPTDGPTQSLCTGTSFAAAVHAARMVSRPRST